MLLAQIRPAVVSFILLTIITGVIYPFLVTGISQAVFHKQAQGSWIIDGKGKIMGSSLIGQNFDDPKYFWDRLSGTSPVYNASASSGSNLGPLNPSLTDNIKARIATLKAADPNNSGLIPVDLVTASGSGLDPHISLAGANYQLSRVARLRGLSPDTVKTIVNQHTNSRFLGVLGEPVVNVLEVNIALDGYQK